MRDLDDIEPDAPEEFEPRFEMAWAGLAVVVRCGGLPFVIAATFAISCPYGLIRWPAVAVAGLIALVFVLCVIDLAAAVVVSIAAVCRAARATQTQTSAQEVSNDHTDT